MTWELRWLSVGPRVAEREEGLVATTPWRLRLLTLGAWVRRVAVDVARREVRLERRLCGFSTWRRTIPFREVAAIAYGFDDWTASNRSAGNGFDRFTVALRLRDETEPVLFHFWGRGEFTNQSGASDWFYLGNFLFDFAGTQADDSRAFAKRLSELLDRPIVPPRH